VKGLAWFICSIFVIGLLFSTEGRILLVIAVIVYFWVKGSKKKKAKNDVNHTQINTTHQQLTNFVSIPQVTSVPKYQPEKIPTLASVKIEPYITFDKMRKLVVKNNEYGNYGW